MPIFKYANLHYQQNIYTPYKNLTKFEPLKPSRSGDISLLVFKISKEAVETAMFGPKNKMFFLKILILLAYILT